MVPVTALVTDDLELSSVTAGVGGVSLGTGTLSSQVPNQYEWEWNTAGFSTGSQTVTVSATDTSGNTTTMSVVVTGVLSIASCEGLLGDEDQNPDQGEGCNPSGVQNVQVPLDNDSEDCQSNNPPEPCTITEFLLTPDPDPNPSLFIDPDVLDICTGDYAFPDPRVDANGVPQIFTTLDVFAVLGGAPVSAPGPLILDGNTFGNPCFAVVFGNRNFVLTEGFPTWPVDDPATPDVDEATGLVIIRTQFEELIPGIGPVTECYDEVDNPDLQEAGQFTYQMDFLSQMIAGTAEVMTNRCFNPKRASTRDLSFNVLNTKEHCGIEFLDPQGELIATAPADVVDCKFQLADAKFDALDLSIDFAAPDLVSPKLSDLTKKFNQARSQFNKKNSGSLARAIADLEDLLFEVKNGTWTVTNDNFPGDVQMRVENLIQRVTLLKRAIENPNFPVQ
jgi:hypothetical protein